MSHKVWEVLLTDVELWHISSNQQAETFYQLFIIVLFLEENDHLFAHTPILWLPFTALIFP